MCKNPSAANNNAGLNQLLANEQNVEPREDNDSEYNEAYKRNQQFVKQGNFVYNTPLSPEEERTFRIWLSQNNVPFDPDAKVTDYDMRGFYKALLAGDEKAKSAVDRNDQRLHYPDYWKTPYHETFSNESQWATPNAPHWTDDDKLVTQGGKVVFDDRKAAKPADNKKTPK